jgi:hypothetical protein
MQNLLNYIAVNWMECFPDWENIPFGNWSRYGLFIEEDIEIGLYHEPDDDCECARTYTMMAFKKDDVIFLTQCFN